MEHRTVVEPSRFDALADEAYGAWLDERPDTVAFDTETTGVAFFDTAFGGSIAWREGEEVVGHYFELWQEKPARLFREIIEGTGTWVLHNPKFDFQKLILSGIIHRDSMEGRTIHDTEAIAHLLDENQGKKLKDLAVHHLDWTDVIEVPLKSDPSRTRLVSREKYELDQARRELGLKISDGFDKLPREVLMPYAVQDSVMTLRLFEKLWPQLEAQDDELKALYRREMALTLVLLDVEQAGLRVDSEYVAQTSSMVAREMFRQELTIRKLTGREEFVDHWQWIQTAFTERGVEVPNTRKETLRELGEDELATAILEYRRLKKLYSTYLQALSTEQREGIVHPNFRQHGTRTGRMSAGGVSE